MKFSLGMPVVHVDEREHKVYGKMIVVEILDEEASMEQARHPILCRSEKLGMILDFHENELSVIN